MLHCSLSDGDAVLRIVETPAGRIQLSDGVVRLRSPPGGGRYAFLVRCTNRDLLVRPATGSIGPGEEEREIVMRPTPALLSDWLEGGGLLAGQEGPEPWLRVLVQWFALEDSLYERLTAMTAADRTQELRELSRLEPTATELRENSVEGRLVMRKGEAAPVEVQEGRVLSIQSHTVHGYVGNKSAVFPMQLLGLDVDPINSVQFSNHTGYARFTGEALNGEQLLALADGMSSNGLLRHTHLLTGYIGSVSFLESVRELLRRSRESNPDLVYVCDPVMGDHGKLYVSPELVPVFREQLIPLATVLTPNQYEAELLTQTPINSEADARRACLALHEMGPRLVVLTSTLFASNPDVLVVIASEAGAGHMHRIEIPRREGSYTGTGDLFAALLLAWTHREPGNVALALERVLATLQAVLQNTPPSGELRLIQSKTSIENPRVINTAHRVACEVNMIIVDPALVGDFDAAGLPIRVRLVCECAEPTAEAVGELLEEGRHISNVVVVGRAEFVRAAARTGATVCLIADPGLPTPPALADHVFSDIGEVRAVLA